MGPICITCGPASAPIDAVRRITNFATGEIGAILSEEFSRAGHPVTCFRGVGATFPGGVGEIREFTTNESLAEALRALTPAAVFHAAALCDYDVVRVEGGSGGKLESRGGEIQLTLRPAKKLLPEFRGWFPGAFLVGWKYEVDGMPEDVVARGRRQLAEAKTDLCVVNGPAFGVGFGILHPDTALEHLPDKRELAKRLVQIFTDRT